MKFRNKQCSSNPFQHYTFTDFFCDKELADIENIKIDDHSASLDGERASNGNRFFVNKDNMWSSSALNRIVDFFLRDETINMFESESNLKIRGNYLRIELIEDREKSWLEPHVDINEKIMSFLVYLNTTDESPDIGTALYNNKKEYITTVPFINNTGFYFYPSNNTWHGLESINIKERRRAIMVNYCTFKTEFKVN
jgi:hypothetical protein|tara:strand:+ start:4065 stop:4652 length:588 start_codon:yes stop_codon:yes gene_type:complete